MSLQEKNEALIKALAEMLNATGALFTKPREIGEWSPEWERARKACDAAKVALKQGRDGT